MTTDSIEFAAPDAAPDVYAFFASPAGTPQETPVDLRAYAAQVRWRKETGGITVGNAPIATDRESQSLINGLWVSTQVTPAITVQFKTSAGYVPLSAAQIQTIAAAVHAHAQACRSVEGGLDAAITAGTVTTTAQVDQAFAAVTV
ncbi:MAG: DUF4376 domain-containing protein [Janthinobacterium lividum]